MDENVSSSQRGGSSRAETSPKQHIASRRYEFRSLRIAQTLSHAHLIHCISVRQHLLLVTYPEIGDYLKAYLLTNHSLMFLTNVAQVLNATIVSPDFFYALIGGLES